MSEESDPFMDKSRLEKMIALGIYDSKMVDKVRTLGVDNTPASASSTSTLRPKESGFEDSFRAPFKSHGFKPIENNAFKWSEPGMRKRQRTPSPVRRERIRDEIQNKISRNEMERKLNVDYFKSKNENNDFDDRNSGNNIDTDLRPKADIDSRLRDTDCRPNQSTTDRKTADNLPFIASTANDEDFRSLQRDHQSVAFREKFIDGVENRIRFNRHNSKPNPNSSHFFDTVRPKPQEKKETIADIDEFIRNCNTKPDPKPLQGFDDIDDFIKQCEQKLGSKSSTRDRDGGMGRRRTSQNQRQDSNNRQHYNRANANESYARNIAPSNRFDRPSDNSYINRFEENRINADIESTSVSEKSQNSSKHIKILKETVEELAKSNLYCQYCDINLSSLVDVNTHIGTAIHQQNMAKKVMEDNNVRINPNPNLNSDQNDRCVDNSETIPALSEPKLIKETKGMSLLVKMIEERKLITLKTLTDMKSYEINTDNEANLAKELAKLLTNELLNYKMNLMPDNVKQALKHQGIGLLNDASNR